MGRSRLPLVDRGQAGQALEGVDVGKIVPRLARLHGDAAERAGADEAAVARCHYKFSADSWAWRLIQINPGAALPCRNSAQAVRILLIYLNAGIAMWHRLTRYVGAHIERAIRSRS